MVFTFHFWRFVKFEYFGNMSSENTKFQNFHGKLECFWFHNTKVLASVGFSFLYEPLTLHIHGIRAVWRLYLRIVFIEGSISFTEGLEIWLRSFQTVRVEVEIVQKMDKVQTRKFVPNKVFFVL